MSLFSFGLGPIAKPLNLRITLQSGEHTELVSDLWQLTDGISLGSFVQECKRLSATISKLRPEVQAVEFYIMEYNMGYVVTAQEAKEPGKDDQDDIRDIFPNAFD